MSASAVNKHHGWTNEDAVCVVQKVVLSKGGSKSTMGTLEGDQENLFFLAASWVRMSVVGSATYLMPLSPKPKLLRPLTL